MNVANTDGFSIGHETIFPHFFFRAGNIYARSGRRRVLTLMHHIEVSETGEFTFEEQVHCPGRAMALLFKDQFRAVMGKVHLALPFLQRGLVLVL